MDRSEDKTVINVPVRDTEHGNWLSKGYVLEGRYVIEDQLGAGGFGITYLAKHRYLEDIWVAIKEYLPYGAAVRDAGSRVSVVSERYSKMYSWGLHRFLDEARLLRQFNHPNIISVQDFFEANNTAYLVMNYVRGRSLQAELDRGRIFDEEKLRRIIYPLLDALQCIHLVGLYHRDISPDNILLREEDGTPVLIDFGSARYAMRMHGAEQIKGGQGHSPTAIFKPGYSPIEQYESTNQGPYTDIYALGATLYRAALGTRPIDALKRSGELRMKSIDPLEPASKKGQGKFSKEFLTAIDAALQLEVGDRPQTTEAWLDILGKPTQAEAQPIRPAPRKPFWRSPKVIVSVITITITVAAGLIAVDQLRYTRDDIPTLLSEAAMILEKAPFSTKGLDSVRNFYLHVLTLDQENARALSGYSATTTLKQFFEAIEENDLDKAATFLDKAERDLRRAGIDIGVLTPGRQRLKLLGSEATLRREVIRQPLSAENWSDIALLLDDMATLEGGEPLAEAGRRGLETLRATASSMQQNNFDSAWSQIADAEQQLSPLGISKLPTARTQILAAQKEWQATRDAEIETLLRAAEQQMEVRPLTMEQLQKARETYQAALDLGPEQPRARAGLSIADSLLHSLSVTRKGDFAAADKALSDARNAAGNTNLWNGALEETERQLAAARQAWSISETRTSTRTLLAQAAEGLLADPFGEGTLSQAERSLQKAQELSLKVPELAAEVKAASAGSDLVALLQDSRTLLESADFDGARNRIQSEETRTLSYRIGLGHPFIEKTRRFISSAEIAWNLRQAAALLSKGPLDSVVQNKARQHLQRVQALDAGHAVGMSALGAVESLQRAIEALQGHDYETAVSTLQQARPPLITLGVAASLLESTAASIHDQQQAWEFQQRENTIAAKLSDAISILQQHPFDTAAWKKSESIFSEIATIKEGSERADSGKSILAALESAKQASDSGRFVDAQTQITLANEILANIGTGNFDEARNLVEAANHAWELKKQELIAEALAAAKQILSEKDPSTAVLQQARQTYQTALKLDSSQKQAQAGLALVALLEAFLQALQANNFDKADQYLAEAASTAQSVRLDPGLLTRAENQLSTAHSSWQVNQTKQEILALQQRVSELLNQEGDLDQRLVLAEKALQEAAILSQSHKGLDAYATQSSAGLEAIILSRAVKGELERNRFDAAKETLSDIRQRLLEAKLDAGFLDSLSQSTVSAQIDWLLANAARAMNSGLGSVINNNGLDEAEKNFISVRELDSERAEIEPALQGIAALREMTVMRFRHDYDTAQALLERAATGLSRAGIADAAFDAIRQRLTYEQQLWKTLTLERNLNTWTGEAIGILNRSPFDDASWQTAASLAEKITSASANDERGLAVENALNNMRQAKQAIDEQRFGEARTRIGEAQSELVAIGVRNPLKNAAHQLDLATSNARQTQLTLATDALQEDPESGAALTNARTALEPVLAFLPDEPIAKAGIAAIDLIQAADTAIAATEFAKSARLLTAAGRELSSIETSDPLAAQLKKALLGAKRRLASQRPNPSEIYPLISVALQAIANDPLSTEVLDTAEKLLQNVLAMQSDEPTALAGVQAVEQLRIAGRSLAEHAYANARAALELAEKLFADIGLRSAVLAPAWLTLEAAEE